MTIFSVMINAYLLTGNVMEQEIVQMEQMKMAVSIKVIQYFLDFRLGFHKLCKHINTVQEQPRDPILL